MRYLSDWIRSEEYFDDRTVTAAAGTHVSLACAKRGQAKTLTLTRSMTYYGYLKDASQFLREMGMTGDRTP